MQYIDTDYEQKFIGAILNDTSLLEQLRVKKNQLHYESNKNILGAIVELNNEGIEVNEISIYEKLKNKGITISDLSSLSSSAIEINSSTFNTLQNIIIENSNKTNLEYKIIQSVKDLRAGKSFDKVKNEILSIGDMDTGETTHVKTIDECLSKSIQYLDATINGEIKSMKTGYKTLDKHLNGIQKNTFYVIGARPGIGKTGLSLELLKRLGDKNKGIMFSLEMTEVELMQRLQANISNCPLQNIITGNIKSDGMEKITQSLSILSQKKIKIVDDNSTTIEEIERICRNEKQKDGLDFIIIDYLTLIETERKFKSYREEVNYISRSLKKLTNKLNIAVICLVQLNRAVEGRASKEPTMADIRESGQIEQDANVIMLLSSPEDNENILKVDIKKNRNGVANRYINFAYIKSTQRIEEMYLERR